MKKILFCIYGLGIGGIEKCLVNLVNALDPERFDITVAVMNPEYTFRSEIEPHIKIIPFEEQFVNTTDTIPLLHKTPSLPKKIGRLARYILYRLAIKLDLSPWKVQRKLPEHYDLAISYTHVGYVPNYVLDRVHSDRKLLWYHTLRIDPQCLAVYSRFDGIIAVSEFCRQNFLVHFPTLTDKVSVLYNLYDLDSVLNKGGERPKEFSPLVRNIVTVGRLSGEKGWDLAVEACRQLLDLGCSGFRWYWVGDGPARTAAEDAIREKGLEEVFILLGNRSNPYPYVRHCDVYAQTSYREAYCTTVIEAKTLHRAIVSTDIGSVREQLTDGVDGLIVPQDAAALASRIAELLRNDTLLSSLAANSRVDAHQIGQPRQYNDYFDQRSST